STAAVYGTNGDRGDPLVEDQVSEVFLSHYAAQKHASEQAIRLYNKFHRVPATIFRFFNVYGYGQDPSSPYSGVITIYLKQARERLPLVCFGGGTATRDFIAVEDIAAACTRMLALPLQGWNALPMNLGTGSRITIRELAEMIAENVRDSQNKALPILDGPARAGDVLHSLASTTRAKNNLGFTARKTLREGLNQLRTSL
ncbi:MAG: NAD-dependent epimerase/dehydratase family protein, partial [Bdellovibrionota bacterium]